MKVLLIDPAMHFSHNPALFYLYSYLRQHCPEVEVEFLNLAYELAVPGTALEVEAFRRDAEALLTRAGFDVVGISCYTTAYYQSSIEIARLCKQLNPDCTVVVGGFHPTHLPEDFDLPDKPVDFVVRGEGEIALYDIVMGRTPRETVPQVVTGTNLDLAEERVLYWDEIKYHRVGEIGFIGLSRGCPFTCLFCPDRRTGWRVLSPRTALAEVRNMVKAMPHLRFIYFTDPLFGIQKPWRNEFLPLLREADLPISYAAEARVDVIDREMIDGLADLSFRLDMGLESVVPEMLVIMKKSLNPARYLEAFREVDAYMNEKRVPHILNLLFNYPGETNKTVDQSLAFWQSYYREGETSYGYLSPHIFYLAPGSDVWQNFDDYAAKYGCWVAERNWWRQPQWTLDISQLFVASRELAETQQIHRPHQVIAQLHELSLAKMQHQAFEPFPIAPPPLPWVDASLLTGRHATYFDDKPLRLTDRAAAHAKVNGNWLLYNFATDGYFNCSPETSRLVREVVEEGATIDDLTARAAAIYPDPEARRARMRRLLVDLVANDFLHVRYPAQSEPEASPDGTRVVLRTLVGEIELALFAGEASELAANFLRLVRARFYDSLQFLSPNPLDVVELGAYDTRDDGPGYTLPWQTTDRPFRRGAVAQVGLGTALHGSRIRIARSDRLAGDGPQPVFGQVVRGLDVLDALIASDQLLGAEALG